VARIIVKERGFETQACAVREGAVTIGRSSDNVIVLKNRYASSRHCEIVYDGRECELRDLDSTNGVFVNGLKAQTRKLNDGDKIIVGAALLFFVADENAVQVDALVKQLTRGTPEERELAANLLGHFGGAEAVDPLLAVLKVDGEDKVKAAAAEALGLIGEVRSVKTLLSYFDTDDTLVRNSVVRSLIRLADETAVDGIARYLKHSDKKVRVLAAYTLGHVQSTRGTEKLLRALRDDSFAVREAVIKALGELGDDKALEALMRASADPHRYPQVWVIEALGKLRSATAVPLIAKALTASDPEVREAAANALGRLRVKESVPALIAALDDRDSTVRRAAAVSLEKFRRLIRLERGLASAPGSHMETVELSAIGEPDGEGAPGTPMFGEDRSAWEIWWAEQSQ
jgi:HEAT repeat protein